jgi:aspartokinase
VLAGVALLRQCTPQTLDLVLSFGERLSAGILAACCPSRGQPAVFVDARDWLVTDDRFGAALVDHAGQRARLDALRPAWGDAIAVHTGFLGATPDGRTTTLGRNGSDYTATLLAGALAASEVQIWTDVPGVMTGDPTILRDAYPIARMSYQEALELANFGARMFHPRTMVPLIEHKIVLRIRSTMDPDADGTRIDERGAEEAGPTCVTSLENLALLDVRWRKPQPRGRRRHARPAGPRAGRHHRVDGQPGRPRPGRRRRRPRGRRRHRPPRRSTPSSRSSGPAARSTAPACAPRSPSSPSSPSAWTRAPPPRNFSARSARSACPCERSPRA